MDIEFAFSESLCGVKQKVHFKFNCTLFLRDRVLSCSPFNVDIFITFSPCFSPSLPITFKINDILMVKLFIS